MLQYLSPDTIYIARTKFKLEIHERSGQNFEIFFSKLMRLHNSEFLQVKPQGKYGDRKNDGFIKSKGVYYQVYAPENSDNREKKTIDKLVTDFKGLYTYWNSQVTPIREFYYVVNDKYQGTYPSLHTELAKIEQQYQGVKCNPLTPQHLEDIFLKLPLHHIEDILGKIPSAEEISLNVSVLNEVIGHLMSIKKDLGLDGFPVNPNFNDKITFNGLSPVVESLLRFGSYYDGELKDYFKLNSTFTKDDLKNTFNKLYKDGLNEIPDSDDKSDIIFFHILKNAYPEKNITYQHALIILMSYFFSYCDIFEEPPVQRMATLFDDTTF